MGNICRSSMSIERFVLFRWIPIFLPIKKSKNNEVKRSCLKYWNCWFDHIRYEDTYKEGYLLKKFSLVYKKIIGKNLFLLFTFLYHKIWKNMYRKWTHELPQFHNLIKKRSFSTNKMHKYRSINIITEILNLYNSNARLSFYYSEWIIICIKITT